MDPLSVLREFNASKKLQYVHQVGSNVQFGDRYSFPATTPVYKAAGAQATAAFYSLQDVLFYVKNRHLKPQEYVMAANQAGVANVNIVDRKRVLDVLDGIAPLDPALVPTPVGLPLAAAGYEKAVGAGQEVVGPEPAAKRQRTSHDEASAMRSLVEQERQLRNRNIMLLAPNKDFRSVLEAVSNVKKLVTKQAGTAAAAAQNEAAMPPKQTSRGGGNGDMGLLSSQDAHRGSSSRYGTTGQLQAMAPAAKSASSVTPPSGSGYVPIRKPATAIQPPGSQPSGGKGVKPNGDGSGAKRGGGTTAKGGPASGSGKSEVKKGGVPIIIVPSGLTSMINMYNARAFLEEGRFVPAAQAQAAAGGAPKPSQLNIRRTAHRPAPAVEYQLTDRAPPAGSSDWDRVVAVVVQGAKWQFKDWPHRGAKDGDLVEALAKVCGFYIHYSDEKVGPPVSDWNVRLVSLHRENRHKDMTAMLELYRHLDTFLQAKRSSLAY